MSSTDVAPASPPLARRYARQVAGISVALLLASGVVEGVFAYREARTQIGRLQAARAHAAAAEIEQELRHVERGLRMVQALPWGQPGFDAARRREELHRLLALQPSIVDLTDRDAEGRERMFVSRTVPDRVAGTSATAAATATATAAPVVPQPPAAAPSPGYGEPFFDDGAVPNVRLTLPRAGVPAGATEATVNLRFLGDVVSGLRGEGGAKVWVVDARDQLVAHAEPTQVLRGLVLHDHPAVVASRRAGTAASAASTAASAASAASAAAAPAATALVDAIAAPAVDGTPSIVTGVALRVPGWRLFVEQPQAQALAPAIATLQRTLALLAVGGAAALVASAAFARRMAAPIGRLRAATAGLAAGRLDARLDIRADREIEELAADFNAMAARLAQSYRELEDKVAERTRELALKTDAAERASAAKTRFLAAASHDLRQPMHAIGLLVGVLRERLTDAELRALADKTRRATDQMESLFGALLDISRLDAGAVRPRVGPLALAPLLAGVAAAYAPLAAAKGLTLKVRGRDALVHSDAALVERIVGNLVANAIRCTDRGGVIVAVRRRGDAAAVQVVDSGRGIAAEHLESIFDEFVRLPSPGRTDAADDRGLGLGLSIVRRSAEMLGLGLRVASRPARGSTFELTLPAAAWPAPRGAATHAGAAADDADGDAERGDAARLRGAFVLVVDDDGDGRQALATLLQDAGCLVAQAASSAHALAECARHVRAIDALVTDRRLGPGDDGVALIARLRDALDEPALPALLVTADVQFDAPLPAGVARLHKPAGPRALRAALAQALRDAPVGPEATAPGAA